MSVFRVDPSFMQRLVHILNFKHISKLLVNVWRAQAWILNLQWHAANLIYEWVKTSSCVATWFPIHSMQNHWTPMASLMCVDFRETDNQNISFSNQHQRILSSFPALAESEQNCRVFFLWKQRENCRQRQTASLIFSALQLSRTGTWAAIEWNAYQETRITFFIS